MRLLMILVLGFSLVRCGDDDNNKTVFMPATARAVFAPTTETPVDSTIPSSGDSISTEMPTNMTTEQKVEYKEIWGNSTFFICRSEVMSTGKNIRAIFEQSPDGMRHFTVNLTLDDGRTQIFDGYQSPYDMGINSRILVSIDEVVKAAYGLGFDALYEMKFDTNSLTIGVTNGRDDHATTALGVPPASCKLMDAAQ